MRKVSIIGIGETRFGKLPDYGVKDLIREAGNAAIADSGVNKEDIQAVYFGNYDSSFLWGQTNMGPLVTETLGLPKVPAVRTEGACASGTLALRQAFAAISAGLYDVVLVGGMEKMTNQKTSVVTEAIAHAMERDTETGIGMTFPGCFAQIANRYFYEYRNVKREMAMVAQIAHHNATLNPHAQMGKEVALDDILAASLVADPLSLYDCSLVSDGAAFVVLCAEELAAEYQTKHRIIDIAGSGHAGDILSLAQKESLTSLYVTKEAARQAYTMAGLTPADIDLAEVHDCFTITQIINIEDLGFCEKGKGADAIANGETTLEGRIPINAGGGLKAKGHPIGATGIGQIYEVSVQLRGEGGARQIKKADIGLTHNLGGAAGTCLVHILRGRS